MSEPDIWANPYDAYPERLPALIMWPGDNYLPEVHEVDPLAVRDFFEAYSADTEQGDPE